MEMALAQHGTAIIVGSDKALDLPRDRHIFVIPPGMYWYSQPWRDSIYSLPEFRPAELEFANGFVPSNHPLMNYNVFFEKFEIKQDDGKNVAMEMNNQLKVIKIGDHRFMYTPMFGYLEIIADGKASLAQSTFMNGMLEVNGGVKYPSGVVDNRTITSKTARYYWFEQRYYIFSDPSHVHRVSAAALAKIFPKEKSKIKSFVKNHNTNFKKKDDLLEVVSYCNQQL